MLYRPFVAALLAVFLSCYSPLSWAELSETEFMSRFQAAVKAQDGASLERLVRENPEQVQNIYDQLSQVSADTPYAEQLQQLGEMLKKVAAMIAADTEKP